MDVVKVLMITRKSDNGLLDVLISLVSYHIRSHMVYREEWVPARMLVLKGVDCEILRRWERGTSASEDTGLLRGWIMSPTLVGEENETFFIRRGSPKGKAQRGQYLLAVGLRCYISLIFKRPRCIIVPYISYSVHNGRDGIDLFS